MKPLIMTGCRKAGRDDRNRVNIRFFFPSPRGINPEVGEIDLISGDVPRIVVSASAGVTVDRVEIERKEDQRNKRK